MKSQISEYKMLKIAKRSLIKLELKKRLRNDNGALKVGI
jgi:hypothetical protein